MHKVDTQTDGDPTLPLLGLLSEPKKVKGAADLSNGQSNESLERAFIPRNPLKFGKAASFMFLQPLTLLTPSKTILNHHLEHISLILLKKLHLMCVTSLLKSS